MAVKTMPMMKDLVRLQRRMLSSLVNFQGINDRFFVSPCPQHRLSSSSLLVNNHHRLHLPPPHHPFLQRRRVMISPFVDQGLSIPTHTKNQVKLDRERHLQKKKRSKPAYRLVDQQRLRVQGGMGGNGAQSFARTSRRHRMRPNGGHGGNGGCVYLMADPQTHALAYRTPHVTAESGKHGSSQEQHGRHGRNTIVRVPCGVVVRRVLDDDEDWDAERQTVVKKVVNTNTDDSMESDDGNVNNIENVKKEEETNDQHDKLSTTSSTKKKIKMKTEAELEDKPFHSDDQGVQYFRITSRNFKDFQKGMMEEVEDEIEDDEEEDWDSDNDDADIDKKDDNTKPARRTVVLADLDQAGAHVMVARGGRGGLGSIMLLASSCHRRPDNNALSRLAEPRPGEIAFLELELKLIADVGLVGFPNAGKSSLLAALSRATPEIAPYPFTTLHPLIGCIEYRDGLQIRAADVPGLIGGASEGRGCGHEFLRHLERTKALLYVIDGAGVDGRNPTEDLQTLATELRNYKDGDMLKRPAMIVANKMDLLSSQQSEALLQDLAECAKELGIHMADHVMGISAGVTGVGLTPLTRSIRNVVQAHQLSTSTAPSLTTTIAATATHRILQRSNE